MRSLDFARDDAREAQTPRETALFGSLRPVLRSSLFAVRDADGIQRSANHVIPNSRQVLYAAASNQHNRVLLQVMADARNVSRDFNSIG